MRIALLAALTVLLVIFVPPLGFTLAGVLLLAYLLRPKSSITPKMRREADAWAKEPARWKPEDDWKD